MSVLIVGMEMPESCDTCFLSKWDTCNERFYCMFDDCPLVEVSAPHGRLIDADEFVELLDKEYRPTYGVKIFKSLLNARHTVIEAEGTE